MKLPDTKHQLRKEIAIATRKRHVFISKDAGNAWKQIAKNGEGS